MDVPNRHPVPHLLIQAVGLLSAETRRNVERARARLADRQYHVERGNRFALLHRKAVDRYLTLTTELAERITRPRWLHHWLHWLLKGLLAVAEIAAGASALYVGGDPMALSLLTFTGVSIATVLAGSNIGIQIRRREQRQRGGLIKTALASVAIATAMLWYYRYLTLGPLFGTLAFVTTMVAFGSAFLSYLWADQAADDLERARDLCRDLERRARRALNHKKVREFEAAEAPIRLGLADALNQAQQQLNRPRSPFAEPDNRDGAAWDGALSGGPSLDPDAGQALMEHGLVLLLGPDILHLTPKTSLEPDR